MFLVPIEVVGDRGERRKRIINIQPVQAIDQHQGGDLVLTMLDGDEIRAPYTPENLIVFKNALGSVELSSVFPEPAPRPEPPPQTVPTPASVHPAQAHEQRREQPKRKEGS